MGAFYTTLAHNIKDTDKLRTIDNLFSLYIFLLSIVGIAIAFIMVFEGYNIFMIILQFSTQLFLYFFGLYALIFKLPWLEFVEFMAEEDEEEEKNEERA
jgi:hypothetical protein